MRSARTLAIGLLTTLACASKTAEPGLDDAGSETSDPTDHGETDGETGDPDLRCVSVTVLDRHPCRVLPTGLALIEDGPLTTAGLLATDGGFGPIPTFPGQIGCHDALAHDPASGKLWWVESATLHQFDLATGTDDWQRALVYPEFDATTVHELLVHEGGLYLGGAVEASADRDWPEQRSLLARVDPDADGAAIWTQIGQLGHGFSPDSQQPLDTIYSLYGITSRVAFLGAVHGIDSSALTLATAEPTTGELFWSTSVIRDTYGWTVMIDGRDDLLAWTLGQWSGFAEPADVAVTDTYAVSGFGAPRWQLENLAWPGLVTPWFHQAVLDDRLVQIVAEGAIVPRYLERDLDGELGCEAELPELLGDAGLSWARAWTLGGEAIVVHNPTDAQPRTLLLQPNGLHASGPG